MDDIIEIKGLKTLIMNEWTGNLQTHKLNKKQDTSKKDMEKDKSLTLKATPSDDSKEDEYITYLARRFKKIMTKHEKFMKKKKSNNSTNATDLCHKYEKSGHFSRNCPHVQIRVHGPCQVQR